jgi:hypothetical protein
LCYYSWNESGISSAVFLSRHFFHGPQALFARRLEGSGAGIPRLAGNVSGKAREGHSMAIRLRLNQQAELPAAEHR